MKIGIFTDSYLPYTSGVVRSIQTFKEELIKQGHDVYILHPVIKTVARNPVFSGLLPYRRLQTGTLASPYLFPSLKTCYSGSGPGLDPRSLTLLLGRLGARYARKAGIPLVFTYHTLYDQYVHYVPFAQSFTRELAQRVSRDFCNQCDMVIVPTGIIGDYLRRIGVLTQITKVPTGIKIDEFQKGDPDWLRQHYQIAPHDHVLLFVGRLGQEKNVGLLLESFQLINKEINNTTLVLVGGGPEAEELRSKAVKLGIAAKVVFTGTLSPPEVVSCYAGADLFVFTSVTETQGIVIAEAKAAGLPVVAVGANGVSEMVEDGLDGYLTGPDSVHFAERVCQVLKDGKIREDMGRRARLKA